MICQFIGQALWPAAQVLQFWGYWGHAARIDGETSPRRRAAIEE